MYVKYGNKLNWTHRRQQEYLQLFPLLLFFSKTKTKKTKKQIKIKVDSEFLNFYLLEIKYILQ